MKNKGLLITLTLGLGLTLALLWLLNSLPTSVTASTVTEALGSARIQEIRRAPMQIANPVPPHLGVSTFLHPDIEIGSPE